MSLLVHQPNIYST